MKTTYPCGREAIEQVLPHRDPFLWLSRIVKCRPGETVVAEYDVSSDLPLFGGHFPKYPVFPGVLIMEAAAQAASFCILVGRSEGQSLGFLGGLDKAKFRNQVRPGDVLRLKAAITKSSARFAVAEVEAWVGDVLCASALQKYVLGGQGDSNG